MGYLNDLLTTNPIVIDGDTIRPHHKYTDDLYTGGIKMEMERKSKSKPTNYDRIKNMSVEELTALITRLAFFPCELCEREHNASCTHEDCFEIHKKWLLQEVSDED